MSVGVDSVLLEINWIHTGRTAFSVEHLEDILNKNQYGVPRLPEAIWLRSENTLQNRSYLAVPVFDNLIEIIKFSGG
jgi:hypothetical protein